MKAIIAPLHDEIRGLHTLIETDTTVHLHPGKIWHGRIGSTELCLARTGMGARAVSQTTEALCNMFNPESIVMIGYGGATVTNLQQGAVVVSSSVINADNGEKISTDNALAELATSIGEKANLNVQKGTIVSTDRISSPHEKAFMGTNHNAQAVDMEGITFAQAARACNTPWLVVRGIVDPLEMELPADFAPFKDNGTLSITRLLHHFFTNPKTLLKLSPIHFSATKARDSLTTFAKAWLTN